MPISLVQTAKAQSSTSGTLTATFAGAPTSGNLLVAVCYDNSQGIASVSGFIKALEVDFGGLTNEVVIFYKISDGTETSVTLNASPIKRFHIAEFSGIASPTVDGSTSNTATSVTSVNTGSLNTTGASELLIVAAGASASESGTRAWDSGFSLLADDATSPRLLSGYQIVAATGAYSANATLGATAVNAGAFIMGFKAASNKPGQFFHFF